LLIACRDTPGAFGDECACPCATWIQVEAWLDANQDGVRDASEKPLKGVSVRAEWRTLPCESGGKSEKRVDTAVSDANGRADLTARGCTCQEFVVYAEAPAGYKLTTPKSCRAGCGFGFAPRR
jgi:hypothetical protein